MPLPTLAALLARSVGCGCVAGAAWEKGIPPAAPASLRGADAAVAEQLAAAHARFHANATLALLVFAPDLWLPVLLFSPLASDRSDS